MKYKIISNTLKRLSQIVKVEYGYRRKLFVLKELIFSLTYKCNFRCKTCYYANSMDNSAVIGDKELNLDEIKKISLSIKYFSNLLISGGEPFLRDDLADICEVFYLQNKIRTIHLPTNGFHTEKIYDYTRKILTKCRQVHLSIGLSLDGLRETHDKIKGVNGSFDKTLETAKSLAALKKEFKNLKLYIITTVNSLNLNEIIALSEFIKNNLPVHGHEPSPMRGIPYDRALFPPSYEEWSELSKKLQYYHNYWNRKLFRSKLKSFLETNRVRYLYKIYSRILKDKTMPFRCQAGNIIGVLEPNGDIKLCELTETVGNVRSCDYDFRKVWFSKVANLRRETIKSCACTHACFLSPSISVNPPALLGSYFCLKRR